MDIKVGDRVITDSDAQGEVVAILNPDVPFPVVVDFGEPHGEVHFEERELVAIS